MTTKGQQRQESIYAYINSKGYASVTELSELFHVSESTVKRDLSVLAQHELVQRNHGGAFTLADNAIPPYSFREKAAASEKFRISKAASAFVEDGDTLYIDAGTTTFFLYQQIATPNVTVFTNSLSILTTRNENIAHVYALEGEVFPRSMVLRGALSVENLERINPDRIFFSSMGISQDYCILNKYETDCAFVRRLLQMSAQKIFLMDASKIGKSGAFRSAPVERADLVVTDSSISPADAEALRARGAELMIV